MDAKRWRGMITLGCSQGKCKGRTVLGKDGVHASMGTPLCSLWYSGEYTASNGETTCRWCVAGLLVEGETGQSGLIGGVGIFKSSKIGGRPEAVVDAKATGL